MCQFFLMHPGSIVIWLNNVGVIDYFLYIEISSFRVPVQIIEWLALYVCRIDTMDALDFLRMKTYQLFKLLSGCWLQLSHSRQALSLSTSLSKGPPTSLPLAALSPLTTGDLLSFSFFNLISDSHFVYFITVTEILMHLTQLDIQLFLLYFVLS